VWLNYEAQKRFLVKSFSGKIEKYRQGQRKTTKARLERRGRMKEISKLE